MLNIIKKYVFLFTVVFLCVSTEVLAGSLSVNVEKESDTSFTIASFDGFIKSDDEEVRLRMGIYTSDNYEVDYVAITLKLLHIEASTIQTELWKWKKEHLQEGYSRKNCTVWFIFESGSAVRSSKAFMLELNKFELEKMGTSIVLRLLPVKYISGIEEKLCREKLTQIVVEGVCIPITKDYRDDFKKLFAALRKNMGITSRSYYSEGTINYSLRVKGYSRAKKVRDSINEHEECKIGYITDTGEVIAFINDRLAVCSEGDNSDMSQALRDACATGASLTDFCWADGCLIVLGANGWHSYGVPEHIMSVMQQIRDAGESVCSCSFNSSGEYAFVTERYGNKNYYVSDNLTDVVNYMKDNYGPLYSINLSESGVVVCAQDGVYYSGVPHNVAEAIKKLDFRPRYVRFNNSGLYLIVGVDGNVTYSM